MDLAMSGWTSYNGLTNSIGYDSDLRPTSITAPGVESLAFAYDAANRMTGITNGMDATHSETLGYDGLNRLSSMASTADSESYQYDADGNRTSLVVNGATTSYAYPSTSNRLAGVSGGLNGSFGYNANGDTVTVNGLTAYTYDPFERLANAGGVGFVTSAEGQRIEKLAGTGPQYFAPSPDGTLLADHVNNWYDYVWLNGRAVTVISNGGVFPLHDDQTGRPLYMTDPNSHVVDWAAQGLPFDRNVTTNRWGSFNVGFPGQYFDQEDDLWQNGNRDYDASLGRYIESDPIGLAGGVNTYAYVGNNPVSNVDPTGNCPMCFTAAIGAFSGGAAGYVTGGWKGAIVGAIVGGIVGVVAPEGSAEAGGSVGAMFATTVADVGVSAAGGGFATIGANLATDQPWDQDWGYGIGIGALGPLASGEAFFIGAGGTAVYGEAAASGFSVATGGFNVFGTALISNNHSSKCP